MRFLLSRFIQNQDKIAENFQYQCNILTNIILSWILCNLNSNYIKDRKLVMRINVERLADIVRCNGEMYRGA